MERTEQFEVWELNRGKRELVGAFQDFEIAQVLARRRKYRVRLMHVVYEGNKPVREEVLTEIGATRRSE